MFCWVELIQDISINENMTSRYPSEVQNKLEQLESLRSEIPPPSQWLTILVILIRSQVKTKQSQIYKF